MSKSVCKVSEGLKKKTTLGNGFHSYGITKYAVVVLNRLPEHKTSALRPPTPQQFYSEDESLSSSDSEMQWEPHEDSSASEVSLANNKRRAARARKSEPPSKPTCSDDKSKESSKASNDVQDTIPVIISASLGHTSREITSVPPNLPEEEIKVDSIVLARKRQMKWQRGTVTAIHTKEDGRLKYKVNFEEKGKSLVSGHHIAFDHTPKLEQLYVGARVVVRCQENKFKFCPGILAELPSRKNRLRFLVFMDDHTPVYVGLPWIHLVCKQLEDNVDDIPDGPHKCFMTQYMKDWPYPHLTQYKAGQTFNAELNGVQQRCEVQVVDCSLMQVIFQNTQQKEWIHRGSIRLEHMTRFLLLKEGGSQNKEG